MNTYLGYWRHSNLVYVPVHLSASCSLHMSFTDRLPCTWGVFPFRISLEVFFPCVADGLWYWHFFMIHSSTSTKKTCITWSTFMIHSHQQLIHKNVTFLQVQFWSICCALLGKSFYFNGNELVIPSKMAKWRRFESDGIWNQNKDHILCCISCHHPHHYTHVQIMVFWQCTILITKIPVLNWLQNTNFDKVLFWHLFVHKIFGSTYAPKSWGGCPGDSV
jgi:hypothetical protein